MGDCESKGADKGGPNVREFGMKARKMESVKKVSRTPVSNRGMMGICRKVRAIRIDFNARL